MTRKTSFYYSFLVLPAPQRRAITAVFDFCRAVDDAVDLETDPARAIAALSLWRQEVADVFESRPPTTPQGQALQPFVAVGDGFFVQVVAGNFVAAIDDRSTGSRLTVGLRSPCAS